MNPPVLHQRDEVYADAKRKGYSEPKCEQFPREDSGNRREYHQGIPKCGPGIPHSQFLRGLGKPPRLSLRLTKKLQQHDLKIKQGLWILCVSCERFRKSRFQLVAIVRGASKGIGGGIATALGAADARVAVNYSSDREGAERVAQAITDNGGDRIAFVILGWDRCGT